MSPAKRLPLVLTLLGLLPSGCFVGSSSVPVVDSRPAGGVDRESQGLGETAALLPGEPGSTTPATSTRFGYEQGLAADEFRRAVGRQDGLLRRCYEGLLLRMPVVPPGRITVRLTVSPAGVVEHAQVVRTTIDDEPFRQCVEERVQEMRFPRTDTSSVFEQPFDFQPGAGGD